MEQIPEKKVKNDEKFWVNLEQKSVLIEGWGG